MTQRNCCLHDLFRNQATKTPNALALCDGSGQVSYQRLDEESDALAGFLVEIGVGAGDCVGVFMETCSDYAVACIGTLKAGAAFVPLGTSFPETLLHGIWREAQPKVVITKDRYLSQLPQGSEVFYLPIDGDLDWHCNSERNAVRHAISPDSVAFVPYTSGTTGQPKGVMQTHIAAVLSYLSRYKFSSYRVGDRVGCNIFFIWEFLRPLLRGGTCYIIPDDIIFLPRMVLKFIVDNRITEILLTPSILESIIRSVDGGQLRESLKTLNVLWLNGEVVPASLARRAMEILPETARLLNTYSISECHDVATVDLRQVPIKGKDVCPVGYVMDGVSARVLPENGPSFGLTGTGELYISGDGLACGYLGREDLTADRFVNIDGQRYYKTGDVAEIDEDGLITVKGRCDSMAKMRGYSIYLSGIEEILRTHCGAQEAVVLVEDQQEDHKRMVAYVTREPGSTWRIDPRTGVSRKLRSLLSRHLPQYMIPSRFTELEKLPIDERTGKLKRNLLSSTSHASSSKLSCASSRGPVGPSVGERRQAMRRIWSEVLDLDLDVNESEEDWDFFEVGGHSILGVELTLAVEEVFGTKLTGSEIYNYPTVNQLVEYLSEEAPTSGRQISLCDDAVLDEQCTVPKGAYCNRLGGASSILLTGATGFLGAFLLDELLRSTPDNVNFYCLVRGNVVDPDNWSTRVIETQKYYGLPSQGFANRIVPVSGDLTKDRFGLEDDVYLELAKRVDLVFHCAAAVNYVYPYSALKPHTVGGTLEVLKFACHSRTKPVQYVSSNGVFPGGDSSPYLENRCIRKYSDRLERGYNQSKWVAEQLVWAAQDRGLPVCIYRPGNIGHHSVTGVINPNDFQTIILSSCARIDSAPLVSDWYFEMTPVDFLAKTIRTFAEDPAHWGNVYNIVQEAPLPAERVLRFLKDGGHVSRIVPLEEWRTILRRFAQDEDDRDIRMLAQSLEFVEGYLTDTSVYDGSRFSRALSRAGMSRPTVDVRYVTKFLTNPREQ